jgi:hypothetical protein
MLLESDLLIILIAIRAKSLFPFSKRVSIEFICPSLDVSHYLKSNEPSNIKIILVSPTSTMNGDDSICRASRGSTLPWESADSVCNSKDVGIDVNDPTLSCKAILLEEKLSPIFVKSLVVLLEISWEAKDLDGGVIIIIHEAVLAYHRQFHILLKENGCLEFYQGIVVLHSNSF